MDQQNIDAFQNPNTKVNSKLESMSVLILTPRAGSQLIKPRQLKGKLMILPDILQSTDIQVQRCNAEHALSKDNNRMQGFKWSIIKN